MASTTTDPLINYRYKVEIDGMETLGFSKVSEISDETEVFTYKEGGLNSFTHKLPNGTTCTNITLEHGLSLDDTLYKWREAVISGDIDEALKSGTIKIYSENNASTIWEFHGAWPSKLTISGLDASAGEVVVESVELVVERLERYSES